MFVRFASVFVRFASMFAIPMSVPVRPALTFVCSESCRSSSRRLVFWLVPHGNRYP